MARDLKAVNLLNRLLLFTLLSIGVFAIYPVAQEAFPHVLRIKIGVANPCTIQNGIGSPEGVVTATVCSVYLDGTGTTSATLYVKESGSGNTGWVAGGGLQRSVVTLTDAQVKALPTTAVTLVAAPGTGKYIAVAWVELQTKFTTAAYTNIQTTFACIGVQLGTAQCSGRGPTMILANDNAFTPDMTIMSNFLSNTSRRVKLQPYMEAYIDAGAGQEAGYVTPRAIDGTYPDDTISSMENTVLSISADNGGLGNFTGGNAANSLKVITYYRIETVP